MLSTNILYIGSINMSTKKWVAKTTTINLSRQTLEALKVAVEKTGMNKTSLINLAIQEYVKTLK